MERERDFPASRKAGVESATGWILGMPGIGIIAALLAVTLLRLNGADSDPITDYMIMLDRLRRMADEFDILHFHIDQFQFPIFHSIAAKTVTTLHGRQDLPALPRLYAAFQDMPLVSISAAQR